MSLPLVVIEQLARTLRNRETTVTLNTLDAYSRIARKALLGAGGFTAAEAMEVYAGQLADALPLPFAEHNFASDYSHVVFDNLRVEAGNQNATRGFSNRNMNWIVVARGIEGDYAIAAADPHFFELGEVVRPFDLALIEEDQPVKYNNLLLSHGLAVYAIKSWEDVAVVLNGVYNPRINNEFTIDMEVELPTPVNAQPKPGELPHTSDSLTMAGSDVKANGVAILDGKPLPQGILLPDDVTEEQKGQIRLLIESFLAKNSAPADEKEEAIDKLVGRLYELYSADFRKLLGRIEGNVSDIKLRRAFKEHFVAKWNLNK